MGDNNRYKSYINGGLYKKNAYQFAFFEIGMIKYYNHQPKIILNMGGWVLRMFYIDNRTGIDYFIESKNGRDIFKIS